MKNNQRNKIGKGFLVLAIILQFTPQAFANEVIQTVQQQNQQAAISVPANSAAVLEEEAQQPYEYTSDLSEMDNPLSEPTANVLAEAAENPNAIAPTMLPNRPQIGVFERAPNRQQSSVDQSSTSQVRFNYDVRGPQTNSFAALSIQFDNLGTTAVERGNLSGLSEIAFSIASNNTCGSARACLKIEFQDVAGRKVSFSLRNISTTAKLVSFSKKKILTKNPSFRLDKVRFINFVYDKVLTKSTTRTGYLDIVSGGLAYTPVVFPGTGPVSDLSAHEPNLNLLEPAGRNTVTRLAQTSDAHIEFDYNLANGADADFSRWGGALLNFAQTPFDLTQQDLVFSVSATGTQKLKLELTSGTGVDARKMHVILQGLDGSPQFYRISEALIQSSGLTDFNLANITSAGFVVDDQAAGSLTAAGTIKIDTLGIAYVPALTPSQINPALMTPLPGNPQRTLLKPAGNPSTLSVGAGNTGFYLDYQTGADEWAGAGFTYDNFGTEDIESADLSAMPEIMFRLRGIPSRVKMEVQDALGQKTIVYLDGIRTDLDQVWSISTAALMGVDLTRVRTIYFIVEGLNQTGWLEAYPVPLQP